MHLRHNSLSHSTFSLGLRVVFAASLAISLPIAALASSHMVCESLFHVLSPKEEAKLIGFFLKENKGTSNQSTVKWIENTDHKVIFIKKKSDMWLSRHNALEESLTAEGDLRLPMFLMGSELAAHMGFAIHEFEDRIEIAIPDAKSLGIVVSQINQSLKSRGLEPITYLPVYTGYITIQEGFDLALAAKGDYQVFFPYADDFPALVPHEASFHLGAMMLPSKVTKRARLITEETQSFLKLINLHRKEIGSEKTQELIDQIMHERVFEHDAGFASLVTSPAHARRDNDMKTYREIFSKISDKFWFYMKRDIEYLNRPGLQPYEAVLARLQIMTGVDLSEFIGNDTRGFIAFERLDQGIGKKVELTAKQKQSLKDVVVRYMSTPHLTAEITTSKALAEDYIQYLDKRISDINASFM